MSIYKRHFKVGSGKLADEITRIRDSRKAASETVKQFEKEIGASGTYFSTFSGDIMGFKFDERPDDQVWRRRKGGDFYVPRKITRVGKAMMKRIGNLPKVEPVQDALRVIGLGRLPVLFDNRNGYACSLYGYLDGPMFVAVPWKDVDPEELEKYRAYSANGNCYSSQMEHLMWIPPSELTEVKEWEALKAIDQFKAQEQAQEALS